MHRCTQTALSKNSYYLLVPAYPIKLGCRLQTANSYACTLRGQCKHSHCTDYSKTCLTKPSIRREVCKRISNSTLNSVKQLCALLQTVRRHLSTSHPSAVRSIRGAAVARTLAQLPLPTLKRSGYLRDAPADDKASIRRKSTLYGTAAALRPH